MWRCFCEDLEIYLVLILDRRSRCGVLSHASRRSGPELEKRRRFFYNLARTLISGPYYIHSLLMVIYESFDVVLNYGLSRYFKKFEWLLSASTRKALQNLFLCFWTKSVFKRNLNPKLMARSCSAIREEKIVLFLMTISSGRLLE